MPGPPAFLPYCLPGLMALGSFQLLLACLPPSLWCQVNLLWRMVWISPGTLQEVMEQGPVPTSPVLQADPQQISASLSSLQQCVLCKLPPPFTVLGLIGGLARDTS